MFQRFIVYWHNLSIKQALGLVVVFSIFLSVPLTYLVIQREQNIFSFADNTPNEQQEIDESLVPYPTEPPKIFHVEKFYGKPGDSVLIYGENFGEVQKESRVYLNDTPLDRSTTAYWSDNEIEFSLPAKPGIYTVTVLVNNNSAGWWGRVNIYDDLTATKISLSDETSIVTVPNSSFTATVYTVNGNATVLGTPFYEIKIEPSAYNYSSSNILYVELRQNDILVPFGISAL